MSLILEIKYYDSWEVIKHEKYTVSYIANNLEIIWCPASFQTAYSVFFPNCMHMHFMNVVTMTSYHLSFSKLEMCNYEKKHATS